jgi:cytochrome P450
MQPYTELDLYHLALEEAGFAADPAPELVKARGVHPWLAKSNLGPVVTHYPVVREIMSMEGKLRNPFDNLIEKMGAEGTPWGNFQHNHILNMIGDKHKQMRDILAPAFTPREANRHRDLMRQTISDLLDEWLPRGSFDFEEFISHYPIAVMCRMIGAPVEAIPPLRWALEALGMSGSRRVDMLDTLNEAVLSLERFANDLIVQREATWTSGDNADLLDTLIEARQGGGMTHDELVNLLVFLFGAGYDTSKNVMTLIMHQMVRHPDIYERCAESTAFCSRVADESMRFHGPVNGARILTDDIEHRGVHFPRGTMIWFPKSVIGQDPATADDADKFNPDREVKQAHLGFGYGSHICLGQFIARAQIAEGLQIIARRMKNPTSPGPAAWRPFMGVWGIKGLPVEFEAA